MTVKDDKIVVKFKSVGSGLMRAGIKGWYAGGFIGRPFRLDVTRHLKQGANKFKIEPFAPKAVRLRVLKK